MHSYLRSIGFRNLEKKKQLDEILQEVLEHYDEKTVVESHPDRLFAEITKYYGCDCGITVCGEYDEENEFHLEYYFPFFRGTGITTQETVAVERHAGKESFAGGCDDVRIGVTLIFYLQNAAEYMTEVYKGTFRSENQPVTLTGLGKEGMILFPVKKDQEQVRIARESSANRNQLIEAARNGDEDAIEDLTMDDIDTYTMISRRIADEDLFSIVDSYFMPYGMECDQYSVMGDIVESFSFCNTSTGEEILQLTIDCNDMQFDVCINKDDLLGEPQVGRRFKGVIWLQGQIHF